MWWYSGKPTGPLLGWSFSPTSAFLFRRSFHSKYATVARAITSMPMPAPMPACAARGRAEDSDDWNGVLASELVDEVGADWVWSLSEVSVGGVVGKVVLAPVTTGSPSAEVVFRLWTTTKCAALLSHVAQACGFEGNTLNRATPSSQQNARWPSQQKEVSVLVTLEQEMRSCPPRIAPGVIVSDSPPG